MLSKLVFMASCLSLLILDNIEASNENYAKGDYIQYKVFSQVLDEKFWPDVFHRSLQGTCHALKDHQAKVLEKAEEYFKATLYAEAIPCYEQLLECINKELYPFDDSILEREIFLLCRLGRAYFYMEEYELAKKYILRAQIYFGELSPHLKLLKDESYYFLALCYRYSNQHVLAIEILKKQQHLINNGISLRELKFELGLNYFLLNKASLAIKNFKCVCLHRDESIIYIMAELYLTHIYLAQKSFLLAKASIDKLAELQLDKVQMEQFTYLAGEIAYKMANYEAAIAYFEKAFFENVDIQLSFWQQESLYRLGWSYLKLVKQSRPSIEHAVMQFERAEKAFEKLLKNQKQERSYLAVAQCHLIKAHFLVESLIGEEKMAQFACTAANAILSETKYFTSLEGQAKALLLQAENASTGELREMHFEKLLKEKYKATTPYLKGCFTCGLHHYKEAEELEKNDVNQSKQAFIKAAEYFGRCFSISLDKHPRQACLALKWQIYAYQKENSLSSLLTAWRILTRAFEQHFDIIERLKLTNEMRYLQGSVAAKLAVIQGHEAFALNAEEILLTNIKNNSDKLFSDLNLYTLGSLYLSLNKDVECENIFLRLINECPLSSLRDASLHWCIQVSEKLKRDNEMIRNYRKELFEKYGLSLYAPIAYFYYYSYRDYLQGDALAFKHLKNMEKCFPNSPLLINAHYLLGLEYKRERKVAEQRIRKKRLLKATAAFNAAEKLFEYLYAQKIIDVDEHSYYALIRFKALLERAQTNQYIGEKSKQSSRKIFYQYAKDLYRKINSELEDRNHPWSQLVGCGANLMPLIQEEAIYAELQFDINNKRCSLQKTIEGILSKYQSAGINKGYYLSRIYCEYARLKAVAAEYESAWQAYMRAEECDQGKYLSIDQRLDLWIQQSICYTNLGLTDKAMLMLSKVINHKAISSLRVQAMYMRAHIYKLQGRQDLARKQLEATAKKGGEWASKAKFALDNEY